jgi:hypothetical protein
MPGAKDGNPEEGERAKRDPEKKCLQQTRKIQKSDAIVFCILISLCSNLK